MIIKNPENTEYYSYVEGTINGYKSFGDYGSVIIYNRDGDLNPVIHRAIVWLYYNDGKGTWSCPSLANYKGSWECSSGPDYTNLSGSLIFYDITKSCKTVKIDLNSITENNRKDGFLTMGDNPVTNTYFDQTGIISHPIGKSDIRAIAVYEIPWMGVIKVYMTEGKRKYLDCVPNSINCLIMLFTMVFAIIYCCDFYHSHKETLARRREIEKIINGEE